MKQGKFIVFEGGEGSGKTHHVNLTEKWLLQRDETVKTTHEPGAGTFGTAVRELIVNSDIPLNPKTELALFLADRSEHVATLIEPALELGHVICDRFSGSTLAYQIGGRKLSNPELIMQCEAYFRNDLEPDMVIYLDVDPKIGIARKYKQDAHEINSFEREQIEFHQHVRSYFQTLADKHDHWIQLDAARDLDTVQADILNILTPIFDGSSN